MRFKEHVLQIRKQQPALRLARRIAKSLGVLALAGLACSARAQDDAQGGVGLHYGVGDHYQRVELVYETPALELHEFERLGRLDLSGELGVAYWLASGSRSPGNVWQFNAIPMFRWWMTDRFYVEAGIGATVFTRTRFADEDISTAFQFGDHIGVGFNIAAHSRVGLRYSHFSNAGIKRPNPGLDIVQLTYLYEF